MQSRRDQVQAHLFVMSRLGAGLLRAEPDDPDIPTGRTTRGIRTGLLIAGALALVTALYGVIKPGGATAWRKPGTMVVVKESGARFLYIGGELHPVLNQASARLLAGEKMALAQVTEGSLSGTPRGGPVGILGAPDALPSARAMTADGWLACAVQETAPSGGASPRLALAIAPDGHGSPLTPAQGLLISTPDGTQYLLWQGRRLRLDTTNGATRALGYTSAAPFPVTEAFLGSLPAGPDLATPDIPGRGTEGPDLAGRSTKVGQLFTGPAGEHYVLGKGGLEQLTATLYELLRGDPRTQRDAYGGTPAIAAPVGAADLTAHPAAAPGPAAGLPADPPGLLTPAQSQGVCAALEPAAAGPRTLVTLVEAAAVGGAAPAVQPGVQPGCAEADLIAVRPGGGALVRALSGAGAGSTLYLVTDNGVKYPLPSPEAGRKLGYGAVTPAAVPGSLLTLLPTGPSLDPDVLAGGGVVARTTAPESCSAARTG
jgi:type VII secretion protein EccB